MGCSRNRVLDPLLVGSLFDQLLCRVALRIEHRVVHACAKNTPAACYEPAEIEKRPPGDTETHGESRVIYPARPACMRTLWPRRPRRRPPCPSRSRRRCPTSRRAPRRQRGGSGKVMEQHRNGSDRSRNGTETAAGKDHGKAVPYAVQVRVIRGHLVRALLARHRPVLGDRVADALRVRREGLSIWPDGREQAVSFVGVKAQS